MTLRKLCLIGILLTTIPVQAQKRLDWNEWKMLDASKISGIPAIGIAGQSAVIMNDFLYVLGGTNFPKGMPWMGGVKKYYNELRRYRIGRNGKLTSTTTLANYPFPIAYAATAVYESNWIIIGGESGGKQQTSVFMMDLKLKTKRFASLPDLPMPLANAQAMVIGNFVHVVGGETGLLTSDKHIVLDLEHTESGWQLQKKLPYPVSHAVLLKDEINNGFVLAGGRAKNKDAPSRFYSSTLAYDPKTEEWHLDKDLPFPIAAGTGISLPNGKLFLFGGDTGAVFNQVENCMLQTAKTTNPDSISVWNKRRVDLQQNHPGFSQVIFEYNNQTGEWKPTGELPFPTPVTTAAVRNNRYLVIPGGEIKAGVRTPLFFMHKIPG